MGGQWEFMGGSVGVWEVMRVQWEIMGVQWEDHEYPRLDKIKKYSSWTKMQDHEKSKSKMQNHENTRLEKIKTRSKAAEKEIEQSLKTEIIFLILVKTWQLSVWGWGPKGMLGVFDWQNQKI